MVIGVTYSQSRPTGAADDASLAELAPGQGDVFDEGHEYTESQMPPAKLEHGTYIKGLYLEGAGWDAERRVLKDKS